jgi:hypothetical protein
MLKHLQCLIEIESKHPKRRAGNARQKKRNRQFYLGRQIRHPPHATLR